MMAPVSSQCLVYNAKYTCVCSSLIFLKGEAAYSEYWCFEPSETLLRIQYWAEGWQKAVWMVQQSDW